MVPRSIILGKEERIWKEFRDANGDLTNVTNARLDIYDPEGTVLISSASGVNESTGVYYYDWTISSAAASVEGYYQVWWSGAVGGVTVQQDKPDYWLGRRQAYTVGLGGEIVDDVRRLIGDNDSDHYHITQVDMLHFISDGVDYIQRKYNMGYTVTISPTSISFNKTLTTVASDLFKRGVAYVILQGLSHSGLWGAGSIDVGDMRINLTHVNKARRDAVRDMRDELDKDIRSLYMQSTTGGVSIENYNEGVLETVGSWISANLR